MQIGMIGIGRMGGDMVRRLLRQGHDCVVCDRDAKALAALAAEGAKATEKLADFVNQLAKPSIVWLIFPSYGDAAAW